MTDAQLDLLEKTLKDTHPNVQRMVAPDLALQLLADLKSARAQLDKARAWIRGDWEETDPVGAVISAAKSYQKRCEEFAGLFLGPEDSMPPCGDVEDWWDTCNQALEDAQGINQAEGAGWGFAGEAEDKLKAEREARAKAEHQLAEARSIMEGVLLQAGYTCMSAYEEVEGFLGVNWSGDLQQFVYPNGKPITGAPPEEVKE